VFDLRDLLVVEDPRPLRRGNPGTGIEDSHIDRVAAGVDDRDLHRRIGLLGVCDRVVDHFLEDGVQSRARSDRGVDRLGHRDRTRGVLLSEVADDRLENVPNVSRRLFPASVEGDIGELFRRFGHLDERARGLCDFGHVLAVCVGFDLR